MYAQNTGLVAIFTGRPNQSGSTLLTETMLAEAESEGQDCRYLELELSQLNRAATVAIVKDVLSSVAAVSSSSADPATPGPMEVDEETLSRIYEASKGNPMYVYELTKTIYEQN